MRRDQVVDDFFGTPVEDPFRFLEDPTSLDTKAFVDAQNEHTFRYLRRLPWRERFATRLAQLYDYSRYSLPIRADGLMFYGRNSGLQNQPVFYRRGDGVDSVFLDPNTLSEDGTVAVTNLTPSPHGALVAYALSSGGSDWQTIHVRDGVGGRELSDCVEWVKFSSIAWTDDERGFFYTRFPQPGTVPPEEESHHSKVYYHEVGTAQAADRLVYAEPGDPELGFDPHVTEDGRFLILHVWRGTSPKNRLYVQDLAAGGPIVRLLDQEDAAYVFVAHDGDVFYLWTDLDAPRRRLVALRLQSGTTTMHTVVPEGAATLSEAHRTLDRFLLTYTQDASQYLQIVSKDGQEEGRVPLPGVGSVTGVDCKASDPTVYLQFTSYLYPQQVFAYDVDTKVLSPLFPAERSFDPGLYETTQVFCTSADGTRVPLFVTAKKGLRRTGDHPTLLYGYGGFNVGLTPAFSPSVIHWLEIGGVYAVANLRGGDEYGEAWHEAGMLDQKQHVFDDFHASAAWLIENGYSRPDRLAIQGGSNGGLLVAACMLQQPALYGAVLCQVPVADMLRYHLFTVGRYWVSEYGNATRSKEEFDVLYAYSPLHNVRSGAVYPPVLITTADTDDRVVPAHSLKFAATLLAAAPDEADRVYLRVETRAGHGAGKPLSKVIEEQADMQAFVCDQLRVFAPSDADGPTS